MKLRATAMPIATPTPFSPIATASAAATTAALIVDVLSARTSTLPTLWADVPIALSTMEAVV